MQERVSLPSLPPELWICIHRLAIEDISPHEFLDPVYSTPATPDQLDDHSVRRFLKVSLSLVSVCRLWNRLAQELLYENVWLTDTRRWASLSAALQRPDIARHVRSLRLSTTCYEHNVEALRYCPQVEVLVQPELPHPELLYAAPSVPLPLLHSLRHLYWVESQGSSAILDKVLSAAPNLEHIFLTSPATIIGIRSASTPIELPNLPHLKSLVLTWLHMEHAFAILRNDLQHLTHLTVNLSDFTRDTALSLPALTSLAFVGLSGPARVPYPTICAHCPALRELRYNASLFSEPPAAGQTAPALTYIQLYLSAPRLHRPAYSHFLRFFEAPAFAALERVVLEGFGWAYLARRVKLGAGPLRARGCRVEFSADGDYHPP
ncbi:hypothetical protein GGX14DRAFT_662104 [Mycena pura]|uniref:F-box domain-containing protein n=1 Tax=Mycena pura TaxID=153505 RepID=A0AAD6V3Y3_9AGAR|nr:hypothetical protein GGX14DRAFT_662104 [Mycena pura]